VKNTPVWHQHRTESGVTRVRKNVPANSATNSARPIPTGAMNVALLFSAANIRTVKTSSAVRNISIKTPCAVVTFGVKEVSIDSGPGNMADTSPAATIPPIICAGNNRAPRRAGRVPVITIPRVTCSLLSKVIEDPNSVIGLQLG